MDMNKELLQSYLGISQESINRCDDGYLQAVWNSQHFNEWKEWN